MGWRKKRKAMDSEESFSERKPEVGVISQGNIVCSRRFRPEPESRRTAGMANHLRFVARTVMVQDGNVEAAYKALNRCCLAGVQRADRGGAGETPSYSL
ncbi:hypothetical protein AOLI_G00315650 [Acnodon oligacanthus]